MKRLFSFFFFFPALLHSQLQFDFESGSLEVWKQNRDSAWITAKKDAICGGYSLWHRLDDSVSREDRISFAYDSLDTEVSGTTWSFVVRHGYNPSSTNKWSVYLLSENDESGMRPGSQGPAILMGVNFKGSDDLLKLWKQRNGNAEVLVETELNWQEQIGARAMELKAERTVNGEWKVFAGALGGTIICPPGSGLKTTTAPGIQVQADTMRWKLIGTGLDTSRIIPGYFGLYYHYSSRQDRKLWLDNLCISGSFIRDTIPAWIDYVEVPSPTSIRVVFSEEIDLRSAMNPAAYRIIPGEINPEIILPVSMKELMLLFGEDFNSGDSLNLHVVGIRDNKGNISSRMNASFLWYKPVKADLIFNEIMYDPSPRVGLPQYEYIELLNRSAYTIKLSDWLLVAGRKSLEFPEYKLPPGEFLLLCYTEKQNEYPDAGYSIDLINSKTWLPNEGSELRLIYADSAIIDCMEYLPMLHSGDYFALGGWSLERIDPDRECHGSDNWSTSQDKMGGSPGKQNSIYGKNPDLDAPRIVRMYPEKRRQLIIEFSEWMDPSSVVNPGAWQVDGLGSPDSIWLISPGNMISLFYSDGFSEGKGYSLEPGQGLKDCSGNQLEGGQLLRFALPVMPGKDEILISEVLFNPHPYCPDFIELYNASPYTFDLANLLLGNRIPPNGEIVSEGRIITEHRLFFPGEYIALTEEPLELKKFYMVYDPNSLVMTKRMPSMSDVEGKVLVLDMHLNGIDEIAYHKDMHHPALLSPEGVSLERISFSSGSSSNWHSASSTEGYGTPGRRNSQHRDADQGTGQLMVEPELFTPNMDGKDDYLMIRYRFPSPGCRASILIVDPHGRVVRYIAVRELLGTEGTYIWDGTDNNGRITRTGIYLVLAEVSDEAGRIRKFKRTCVLSGSK